MAETHHLMGGKLHVYRREKSGKWQCSAFMAGRNWRVSTKEDSLSRAKEIAEDWYLEMRGKKRSGDLKTGKTFRQVVDQFLTEFEVLAGDERSPEYIRIVKDRFKNHLLPFFGDKLVSEITPALVQEYRIQRMTVKAYKTGQPRRPVYATVKHDIVALRHVLKTAYRHGWLPFVIDLSPPFKMSVKVSHRGWFSPQEYKMLYEETRRRAKDPPDSRSARPYAELHDYVLFMANTGLRPDEAQNLEFRDVVIADDKATKQRILELEVRGKQGYGPCKSMPGAVPPFERLKERSGGDPMSRVFGANNYRMLKNVLIDLKLRIDREGNFRAPYSLRHTYICMRLLEGADIYQIAKNCRTSVEMIEKFYASHIKNSLDAAAINVRRSKPRAA